MNDKKSYSRIKEAIKKVLDNSYGSGELSDVRPYYLQKPLETIAIDKIYFEKVCLKLVKVIIDFPGEQLIQSQGIWGYYDEYLKQLEEDAQTDAAILALKELSSSDAYYLLDILLRIQCRI